MTDAVSTTVTYESASEIEVVCTNISDGTGESAVTKVDVSALTPACAEVSLTDIEFVTSGMAVRVLWDATADTVAFLVPSDQWGRVDFRESARGVLRNNSGAGKTGDVQFTTVGHSSGDTYWIRMRFRKMQTAEV